MTKAGRSCKVKKPQFILLKRFNKTIHKSPKLTVHNKMHLEARSHFSNSNIPRLVGFPVITTCQSESAVFPAASAAKRDRITSFFWCQNWSEYRNREKKVEGRGGVDEVTAKIRPPHPWGEGGGGH